MTLRCRHDCDETLIQVDAYKTGKVHSVSWRTYDEDLQKDREGPSDYEPADDLTSYRFALTNAVAAANGSAVFKSLCLELVLSDDLMISTKICDFYPDAHSAKSMDF